MTFARARHIAFLVCVNNRLVLTGGVKFGQSEGIPDSGILERLPLRKFHRRSLVLSPSLPSFFPPLSLALVFARAPLSERLEQARSKTSPTDSLQVNSLIAKFQVKDSKDAIIVTLGSISFCLSAWISLSLSLSRLMK